MHPTTLFEDVDPENPAYVLLKRPCGRVATFVLDENNSFFAGTGPSCRMILEGTDVHPIHCMFWLNEDGVLCVQDWNTDGKTTLNGAPIDTESELNPKDVLMVGKNKIVPILTLQCHRRTVSELAPYLAQQLDPETDREQEAPASEPASEQETELEEATDVAPVVPDIDALRESIAELEPKQAKSPDFPEGDFTYDVNAESDDAAMADDFRSDFALAPLVIGNVHESNHEPGFFDPQENGEESEEVEMLRMEVEQLRFELSERDSRPPMRAEPANREDSGGEDSEQTERLVNRLEELLEELQASDERARELEELLRVSDQATQAEQEERQQLESWVTEIEQRVCQREEESKAELGRVVSQLNEARSQRDQAASQLQKALESKGGTVDDSSQELVQEFQNQVEALKRRLDELDRENEQLRMASKDDSENPDMAAELKRLEQELLNAQVAASQERAEMARQRAELEQLKDELGQKLKSANDSGSADTRVRAMRQHLREIHEKEELEKEEKKQRSLGGRISNLLTRVNR